MPRRPVPLPPPLQSAAFAVAAARQLGLSAGRLRRGDLSSPVWGVRSTTQEPLLHDRCRALALVLGPHAFSHETAARLLRLPAPPRADHLMHVTTDGANVVRRRDVRGHRGLGARETVMSQGLHCIAPADTLIDLAASSSLVELVQFGDCAINRDPSFSDALHRRLAVRGGGRSVTLARAAARLIRPGSASPMESHARVQVASAGLPEPELNVNLVDDEGNWLACVDLCWRQQRVIVEYDGAVHVSHHQQALDAQRRRLLTAYGWKVIVLTKADVLRREADWIADLSSALGVRCQKVPLRPRT